MCTHPTCLAYTCNDKSPFFSHPVHLQLALFHMSIFSCLSCPAQVALALTPPLRLPLPFLALCSAVISALLSQLLEFQKLQGRPGQILQLLSALFSARACWSAQQAVWAGFICLCLFIAHFICLDAWQMNRSHGPAVSASNSHGISSRGWLMNCSHAASCHLELLSKTLSGS